jgi:hypothetical protein
MKKVTNGISLQTDYGNMKLMVYASNVIKINATRNDYYNDFSYATVAVPDEKVKYDNQGNE